ncbi:MAG: carbon storage regulator CsrA [Desulfobacterales bacterium]|nr:carbon storage regulator CsrA [Desulfobacterales bacterium]
MLVLTRKVGEKINIGDDIVLSVLEINRGNVRLGIDAPRNVTVLRQEVYERIKAENVKSAQGSKTAVFRVVRLWKAAGSRDKE